MSTASVSNGKPQRKQLSEQLDRFDAMLDGLSDGLGQAIADAARAGTQLAVKDAIVEILTNPALRTQLHQATAPSSPPAEEKPGFWARIKAVGQRIGAKIQRAAAATTAVFRGGIQRLGGVLRDPLEVIRILGSVKRLFMIGASAGTLVAFLSYVAPHELSALASGIGAAATAMAVQIGFWARRTFRFFRVA